MAADDVPNMKTHHICTLQFWFNCLNKNILDWT